MSNKYNRENLVNTKYLKETQNITKVKSGLGALKPQPRFGICFDVDGVLARGTLAIPAAVRGIRCLTDEKGDIKVPITFLTNSLNRNQDKAAALTNMLGIPVSPQQMIQAQGPLEIFKKYHNKFCLVLGQGKIHDISKDLGFKNICTIEQVAEAYPLLDMVDHDNRKRVARDGYVEKEMARIEAIILLGEPKRWESSLQLLVDLLKTDGKPNKVPEAVPEKHLPIIACNMDLQFMDRACMPRYGHGAFLLCLEALYKKVTGFSLRYTALVGKPSEITYRYAEHCLTREAKKLGIEEPLQRMYTIGDTPDADIVGANLYQRYIRRLQNRRNNQINDTSSENKNPELWDPELPESRNVPDGVVFNKQTINESLSVLVCTGVYKPGQEPEGEGDEKNYKGHRDFAYQSELYRPTTITADVEEGLQFILQREKISFQ